MRELVKEDLKKFKEQKEKEAVIALVKQKLQEVSVLHEEYAKMLEACIVDESLIDDAAAIKEQIDEKLRHLQTIMPANITITLDDLSK